MIRTRYRAFTRITTLLPAVVASFAVLLGSADAATAQSPPELWLMARGDSVLIHVPEPPAINRGFVVDRAGPGGEWERITEQPVMPVTQPAEAAAILGDARADAMADMRASSDVELMRRLQADRFTAGVMSMLYREVAQVLGRFYVDTGRAEGESYEYRVVFLDRDGEETDEVRRGQVRMAEVLPGTPENPRVEQESDYRVTLSWSYPAYDGAETDFVHGFHIERAVADGGFERVTRTAVVRDDQAPLRWTDEEVEPGARYEYRVRAVDMAGRESEPSTTVAVAPVDDSPPSMPEQLVTEPDDGEVTLTWRMSPEPDVAGYRVERSTGLEEVFEPVQEELVPTETPTLRDREVRGGTQYFYRIVAVDEAGRESRPSNPISAIPVDRTPPEPASVLEVDVAERQLHLRWEPSPSDDVQGYHIYRGDTDERLVRLTRDPHPEPEYVDTGFEGEGLVPGGRYTVRVVAVDHSFNESDPITVEVEIPDDLPPEAPTGLLANNVHGRYVEVRWSASPSLDVERYELTRAGLEGGVELGDPDTGAGADERTATGDEPVTIGTFPADARRVVRDTTVVRGERYRYSLIAVDSAGNRGEATSADVDFRDTAAPPAPRHASATVTDEGVRVSWERVVARDLVGYRVYRAAIPTGVYEPVSELIDDPRVFVDREGRDGLFYTVRAVDASGNESRASPATQARRP